MFENLDDPNPPSPAPIDGVTARGRRLQVRRRAIAGAVAALVVFGTLGTAVALQSGTGKKVVVTDNETTTSVSDTTVPEGTSTSVPETTTSIDNTPSSTSAAVVPITTTTTTQPPHDPTDLSRVSVAWPAATHGDFGNCLGTGVGCANALDISTGASTPITYTVTNNGTWTVQLDECSGRIVDVWADNSAGGFGQYDQVWPAPYPARGTGQSPESCVKTIDNLPPGASRTLTETVVAGYRNAAGAVMPSGPGATSFRPSFLPQCTQPCKTLQTDALVFRVQPSLDATMPFTIDVKTMRPKAVSGQSTTVGMTYVNSLAFSVRTPIFGPCWKVKTGIATLDCSGSLPALIIGPHQTVDLVGTVWARAGFKATGAPLAAGNYAINLGDLYGTNQFQPQFPAPEFTVTAS